MENLSLTDFNWLIDINWKDVVDVFLVAFILYNFLALMRGTRAMQMMWGLAIIFLAYLAAQFMNLFTLRWMLDSFLSAIIIIIVILFQEDIRRALSRFGRNPFYMGVTRTEETQVLEEITRAVKSLGQKKIGALIVLERESMLNDFVTVGTELDSRVERDLLSSIFLPYSPIHDGAVIVRNGRVFAAGCFLPLTMSLKVDKRLGTRHRAALGITEATDSIAVVVSEETGTISLAEGGMIDRELDVVALREKLLQYFQPRKKSFFQRIFS